MSLTYKDVTQTIHVEVITEEDMRRWELANQLRMQARTKLLMLAKNPSLSDKEQLAIIRDAVQDIRDGMSILQRGYTQSLGCNPSRAA